VRAYVDESVREQSPGYYVLAAVVVSEERVDEIRSVLRRLLIPGARRLHWHDERDDARRSLLKAVSVLDVQALAVVSTPMRRTRQERARALCLPACCGSSRSSTCPTSPWRADRTAIGTTRAHKRRVRTF